MTTETEIDTETRAARVREAAHNAREKAEEAYEQARERAGEAYESARTRASAAYESALARAETAKKRTAQGIDTNPTAALVGGLALGALAAMLLPKTQREVQTFGQLGRKVNDRAREAAKAAREAGTDKLEELGLTGEAARDKVKELGRSAADAVSSTASAAADRIKTRPH